MVLGEQDQTIISSYVEDNPNIPFREISASNKEIRIWGAETKSSSSYIQIDHTEETDRTDEWSNNQSSFLVNGIENVGTFTSQEPLEAIEEGGISIGGRFD